MYVNAEIDKAKKYSCSLLSIAWYFLHYVNSSIISCLQRERIVLGLYEPTEDESTWADSEDEAEEENDDKKNDDSDTKKESNG